jgi:hypothetical protein
MKPIIFRGRSGDLAQRPYARPKRPAAAAAVGTPRNPSAAVDERDCMIAHQETATVTATRPRLMPSPVRLLFTNSTISAVR